MVVDFVIRKVPGIKLATSTMKGPWPGDKALRAEFEKVSEWAKAKGLKTGKWVFREFGEYDKPAEMRYEAGIELRTRGPVRGGKGMAVKSLPSSTVASVTFDPDAISPSVIYHGISDYLRWRKKEGKYREAGPYMEVYLGNPWTSKRAWAHTQVQVPVRRLGK
jgi:effector-binding domain-containing protein